MSAPAIAQEILPASLPGPKEHKIYYVSSAAIRPPGDLSDLCPHFNIMSLSTLTQEEITLHFYAALVQKDLDAYITSVSRSRKIWNLTFEHHLVRLYYANHFIA